MNVFGSSHARAVLDLNELGHEDRRGQRELLEEQIEAEAGHLVREEVEGGWLYGLRLFKGPQRGLMDGRCPAAVVVVFADAGNYYS